MISWRAFRNRFYRPAIELTKESVRATEGPAATVEKWRLINESARFEQLWGPTPVLTYEPTEKKVLYAEQEDKKAEEGSEEETARDEVVC